MNRGRAVGGTPAEGRRGRLDGITLLLFAGCVVLAAGNFIAVRYSNRELEPMWGAGLRFALAAVIFTVIAGLSRAKVPRGRDRTLTLVYGLLNFGVFYALMYWSLLHLTAGTATVVTASVPLLTLLLIRRWLPSSSAYVLVVVPTVTLLLEALIAGVPIAAAAVLGAVLVMVGAWFGALSGAK